MATPSPYNLACVRCSKRKTKCDRVAPICGACVRSGSRCVPSDKETDAVRTTDGSLQWKGPVAALEERLASLQRQLDERGIAGPLRDADHGSLDASLGGGTQDRARVLSVQSDNADDARNDVTQTDKPSRDSSVGLDLLTLGAMAEPTRRAGEILRELSIPRLIFAVTDVFGGNPERAERVDMLWDIIAKGARVPQHDLVSLRLPSEEANKYLDSYYEKVDYRYPGLFRKDAERALDAISSVRCGQGQDENSAARPADVFTAYMVIAIVPLVSGTYSQAHGSFVSINMLSRALRLLEQVFQADDGVDVIQCLRLLVIFSIHSPAAGSSWHLISFAMKKCIALGFHREPPRPGPGSDETRIEKQRWTFWSCYLLDR